MKILPRKYLLPAVLRKSSFEMVAAPKPSGELSAAGHPVHV